MFRLHRDNSIGRHAASRSGRGARGFTLPEILIASMITAMLSVVLGGLVMAVQTARQHANGLEDSSLQSRVAMNRVRYMISQAGVYEVSGQPTTLGLAVVNRTWTYFRLPEVLVVWSGGRDGGMAEDGVVARLPQASELVVYAPDPADVSYLMEFTFPAVSSNIDFNAADFDDTIERLLAANSAESVLLCDRLRVSQLSLWGSSKATAGNVWFDFVKTPTDAQLAAVTPGTADWFALPWPQGIVSSESGLRQVTVQMEFQLEPFQSELSSTSSATAIPFFESVSYRHVYKP